MFGMHVYLFISSGGGGGGRTVAQTWDMTSFQNDVAVSAATDGFPVGHTWKALQNLWMVEAPAPTPKPVNSLFCPIIMLAADVQVKYCSGVVFKIDKTILYVSLNSICLNIYI